MQAILRAEKTAGKPKKVLKKGKDRRKHQEAKELLEKEKDRFAVDTKDDRFKSLHEDHEFALDPSNPRCVPVSAMSPLASWLTRAALPLQVHEDQEHGEAAR
jgi:hypothetical protein